MLIKSLKYYWLAYSIVTTLPIILAFVFADRQFAWLLQDMAVFASSLLIILYIFIRSKRTPIKAFNKFLFAGIAVFTIILFTFFSDNIFRVIDPIAAFIVLSDASFKWIRQVKPIIDRATIYTGIVFDLACIVCVPMNVARANLHDQAVESIEPFQTQYWYIVNTQDYCYLIGKITLVAFILLLATRFFMTRFGKKQPV